MDIQTPGADQTQHAVGANQDEGLQQDPEVSQAKSDEY